MKANHLIFVAAVVLAGCQKYSASTASLNEQVDSLKVEGSGSSYFDQILSEGRLVEAEDAQMLAVVDSLFAGDSTQQLYYFLVFTKSLNGQDGFYGEAAGGAALRYLITNPKKLAAYFVDEKLSANDLENWADAIAGEIMIANEGGELKMIHELNIELRERMKSEDEANRLITETLIRRVDSIARNMVKN